MILSRFEIHRDHPDARRDLSNAYEMHRTIKKLCGEDSPLWRREESIVLMQSTVEPVWSNLGEGYLKSQNQRPFPLERLKLEDRDLRFRLRANPTVSQRPDGSTSKGMRGKRWSIFGEEAQQAWLERQGERLGFKLLTVEITESQKLNFPKPNSRTFITLQPCLFDGRLRVTDVARFRETLAKGVGSAKAFGMGMLSLAGG